MDKMKLDDKTDQKNFRFNKKTVLTENWSKTAMLLLDYLPVKLYLFKLFFAFALKFWVVL